MYSGISDELLTLTARLMMTRERNEVVGIAGEFNAVIQKMMTKENATATKEKAITTVLQFTKKEIDKATMATTFKKEFILNGLRARVTKRPSGKNSWCYEIRYRSNGYKIEVSSTDLATAKKKFLAETTPEKIHNHYVNKTGVHTETSFKGFTLYYFEKIRKRKVAENTYKNDLSRLKVHLFPAFARFDIKKITPQDCQELLDKLMEQGKCKTAVEIYNILSCIFKAAIAHDVLTKNPLNIVEKPTYDQENGKALTKGEEQTLLTALNGSIFAVPVALGLFCGLRPNELKTAKIQGDFIIAVNSKRHSKKIEHKRIPISKLLKPHLQNGITEIPNENAIRKAFKDVLPTHKLYDLRTTFYSRCKECGVEMYALNEFMGHSLGRIGKAYTDLSDEYLLKESEKIDY
jgi:integrase